MMRRRLWSRIWRRWRGLRGDYLGSYERLPEFIRNNASGKTFLDVGCMWGVNGAYSFIAEEAGATRVVGIDLFGPTPEFLAERTRKGSAVEFLLGDIGAADSLERLGEMDVVFCAGVLYHHPSPFELLLALRRVCSATLILRTSTIPEVRSLPHAAVYFPLLDDHQRARWSLRRLGLHDQIGISTPYDPGAGYGNWFWGLTPSALAALVRTAGFRIDWTFTEAFAQTIIATPMDAPFTHHVPDEAGGREVGNAISRDGAARPA